MTRLVESDVSALAKGATSCRKKPVKTTMAAGRIHVAVWLRNSGLL